MGCRRTCRDYVSRTGYETGRGQRSAAQALEARARGLKFAATRPFFASLERDPVHPSAYYICVDGIESQPLLLRVATASTPSSGLFPKSILIGRTFVGRTEAVFHAVPFGPGDEQAIRAYASIRNPDLIKEPAAQLWENIRNGAR